MSINYLTYIYIIRMRRQGNVVAHLSVKGGVHYVKGDIPLHVFHLSVNCTLPSRDELFYDCPPNLVQPK